jgi:hypothetical protein
MSPAEVVVVGTVIVVVGTVVVGTVVGGTVVGGTVVVVTVVGGTVVGVTVVVGVSEVSEEPLQAEASKSKQTTAPNFLIPTSLAHRMGVAPVGYCYV